MPNRSLFLVALGALPSFAHGGIAFPPDSGVIDVTQPPYHAVPDDGIDDVAAIQRALNDHPSGNKIFYFPDGTYDLSNALRHLPEGDPLRNTKAALELRGSQKRNILQGESESGTVLRLMDAVPANFDGGVIWFGGSPAQRFRNALRDMTVNVGRGHPSAIGVMFNASNQGGIFRATIRSEDGSGAIGLDLRHADEVGPCLIQRVTVDGFACGIQTAYQTASQTFEHITLRGQSVCGWQNGFSQQIFARKLRSENAVTAIMNRPAGGGDPGQAKFALVEAELIGHGGAAQHAAIRNQKALYLRDVATSGYHAAVTRELDHGRGNPAPDAAVIGEYWANGADDDRRRGGPLEVFQSPDRSLRLPINEEPEVPWDADFARWAGPHQLASGSSGNGAGFPGDGQDDTAALQHALDSGASTVYLPNGVWNLHGSVNVPSGVTRIIGCEARLLGEGTSAGRICIAGNGDPLIIERLEAPGVEFEQSGERALVLKNLLGGSYRRGDAAQVGDLYLSDVCVSACAFRDQKVWARQLNIEGNTAADPAIRAKVFNDGGDVWILGMKNEDEGTVIETVGGGRTELIGCLHVGASGDEPRFITRDASFSAAAVYGGFKTFAVEQRGGETKSIGSNRNADLYTAFAE